MRRNTFWRSLLGFSFAMAVLASIAAAFLVLAPAHQAPASPEESRPGGSALGGRPFNNAGDAEVWRAIRQGVPGTVSIPDKKAAVLIEANGEEWRRWRNGPIGQISARRVERDAGHLRLLQQPP